MINNIDQLTAKMTGISEAELASIVSTIKMNLNLAVHPTLISEQDFMRISGAVYYKDHGLFPVAKPVVDDSMIIGQLSICFHEDGSTWVVIIEKSETVNRGLYDETVILREVFYPHNKQLVQEMIIKIIHHTKDSQKVFEGTSYYHFDHTEQDFVKFAEKDQEYNIADGKETIIQDTYLVVDPKGSEKTI